MQMFGGRIRMGRQLPTEQLPLTNEACLIAMYDQECWLQKGSNYH